MPEVAHPIDLDLVAKLRDRGYRQNFFMAESSARIAAQLIALRKKRGLNQQQVAEMIGTRQPAISRVEKADYQNWSFNTLRNIADALDARIRVYIEPSEDVLGEYENIDEISEGQHLSQNQKPLLPRLNWGVSSHLRFRMRITRLIIRSSSISPGLDISQTTA